MNALIFAAGLGTRLRPLTDHTPKALVEVAGRPMLWHTAMKLKGAGVDRLVINIHHFAQQIVDYVHSEGDFGMKVEFSDESALLLETGGGLLYARRLLEGGGPFLVHNVDIASTLDLGALLDKGLPDGAVASLVTDDGTPPRRLMFEQDGRLCGWTDLSTGALKGPVTQMRPCCLDRLRTRSFSGIHLISDRIYEAFDTFPKYRGAFGIIDFYLEICRQYPIFEFYQSGMHIVDMGRAEQLPDAAEILKI